MAGSKKAAGRKKAERWKNAEPPREFDRECFPPGGIRLLLPHHFIWWARPPAWQRCCCCCCCCHDRPHGGAPAEVGCSIDLRLEANTFGPGKSIHVVVGPGVYFAEFYVEWTASGAGQVTVDVELISGPGAVRLIADDRGPSDRVLFGTHQPGTYVFRATARDARGNTCFDTLQVDVPGI